MIILLFLGAGASKPFGIPDMRELTNKLLTEFNGRYDDKNSITEIMDRVKKLGITPDIEAVLTCVDALNNPKDSIKNAGAFAAYLSRLSRPQDILSYKKEEHFQKLSESIRGIIRDYCFLPKDDSKIKNIIETYDNFFNCLNFDFFNELTVFTTNYDYCFETYCYEKEYDFFDGFEPKMGIQTYIGMDNSDKKLKICKLHGSSNYVFTTRNKLVKTDQIVKPGDRIISGKIVKESMIYPTTEKYFSKDPYYYFVPIDLSHKNTYDKFWSILEIFDKNKIGVCTKRDHFIIDNSPEELEKRIKDLANKNIGKEQITEIYDLNNTYEWDYETALENIKLEGYDKKKLIKYSYRPFDIRYIYYHDQLIARTVRELMTHLLKDNSALIVGRAGQNVKSPIWDLVFVAKHPIDINLFYRGGTTVFPLYIHNKTIKNNFKNGFLNHLKRKINENINEKDVFYYIYAILHCNIFREKYDEFLKYNFPKLPFTNNFDLFKKISRLGGVLVDLHLLNSPLLQKNQATYPINGKDSIEKREYDEKHRRIYINNIQYFGNIPKEIWSFSIGGYQILDKWLKDRKDRKLSFDEIEIYCKIVSSIKHTLKIMEKIDGLYSNVEKNLINCEKLSENSKLRDFGN